MVGTDVIHIIKHGDEVMQDLIKKIRFYMNMNQTEFSELLNVTFATVNRWENGRALPNKLAQDNLESARMKLIESMMFRYTIWF